MTKPSTFWSSVFKMLAAVGLLFGTSSLKATQIIDQRGHIINLNTPAKRVVYIPPALRSYITIDRSTEHIVGTSAFSKRFIDQGLLGKLFPEAGNIPDVTSNGYFAPNIEAVLSVLPDVVFQTTQIGTGPYEQLERIGLKVIGINGGHGENDFLAWARLAGKVSGKAEIADTLIQHFEAERRRLDSVFSDLPETERPKVLHLMSFKPLRPAIAGTAFDEGIRHAGGRNVAAEIKKFGPVTFEQVLTWNPDVILISGWLEEKTTPADLFHSPQWSVLPAVRNRRVYKIPLGGQRFSGIVEGPLFWQWLAELLHPNKMEPDFRNRFKETYRTVFDYPLSKAQIDEAIYAKANGQSAGYQRLLDD